MAVLSSSVEFAWQAAENLSEGGVVRLLMTALQQLECLLMTTFPRTERLLMTILCSACQCFFLLCLFQLIFQAVYFPKMCALKMKYVLRVSKIKLHLLYFEIELLAIISAC